MKNFITFLTLGIFLLAGYKSYAQNPDPVIVTGILVDAETKEPVKARVYYESLPYGSKVGLFNNTAFEFKMDDGEAYSLTMKSQGYLPLNVQINSSEADSARSIEKTFELTPSGVGKVMRLETLNFSQGKSTISKAAYSELDKLVKTMQQNPTMIIQLEGHTDFRGDKKSNFLLSQDRVKATKSYIVSKGIAKKRVLTKAFGGTKPISKSNDASSRLKNRRVEVRVIQL